MILRRWHHTQAEVKSLKGWYRQVVIGFANSLYYFRYRWPQHLVYPVQSHREPLIWFHEQVHSVCLNSNLQKIVNNQSSRSKLMEPDDYFFLPDIEHFIEETLKREIFRKFLNYFRMSGNLQFNQYQLNDIQLTNIMKLIDTT